MSTEEPLYWLSFVRDGEFAGACIVRAADGQAALRRAALLKIYPGGPVALAAIDPAECEEGFYERATQLEGKLFSKEEVMLLFGPIRDVGDSEGMEHVCEECSHAHVQLN